MIKMIIKSSNDQSLHLGWKGHDVFLITKKISKSYFMGHLLHDFFEVWFGCFQQTLWNWAVPWAVWLVSPWRIHGTIVSWTLHENHKHWANIGTVNMDPMLPMQHSNKFSCHSPFSWCIKYYIPSLKRTFLPLKINGWKTIFSFLGCHLFMCEPLISGRVRYLPLTCGGLPFMTPVIRWKKSISRPPPLSNIQSCLSHGVPLLSLRLSQHEASGG